MLSANKYDEVIGKLYSVMLSLPSEEDSKWWELCRFILEQLMQQGLCKTAIDLCDWCLERVTGSLKYELTLVIGRAYHKLG